MNRSDNEKTEKLNKEEKYGYIHSVETCGTVDGPGIRYIIFMQGCPMRCKYCHNPDTWDAKGKDAKKMTVSEVVSDIVKYKSFMKFSGGGVTVSGGEPLMQADFVKEVFKACKKEGIGTALDTSGCVGLDGAKEALSYTDLLLLDIKSIDPETFRRITQRDINNTLEIAECASKTNIPMWIRFVLVPGLSDNKKEIEDLARYIAGLHSVQKVEVLPFHKMGEYKWEELGYKYELKHTPEPSAEEFEAAKAVFKKYGLKVT